MKKHRLVSLFISLMFIFTMTIIPASAEQETELIGVYTVNDLTAIGGAESTGFYNEGEVVVSTSSNLSSYKITEARIIVLNKNSPDTTGFSFKVYCSGCKNYVTYTHIKRDFTPYLMSDFSPWQTFKGGDKLTFRFVPLETTDISVPYQACVLLYGTK